MKFSLPRLKLVIPICIIIAKWIFLVYYSLPFEHHPNLWFLMLLCDTIHVILTSHNAERWKTIFCVTFEIVSIAYVSASTNSDMFIYLYAYNLLVYVITRNLAALLIIIVVLVPVLRQLVPSMAEWVSVSVMLTLIAAIVGTYVNQREMQDSFSAETTEIKVVPLEIDSRKDKGRLSTIMQGLNVISSVSDNEQEMMAHVLKTFLDVVEPAAIAYYFWDYESQIFRNVEKLGYKKNNLMTPAESIRADSSTMIGTVYHNQENQTYFVSDIEQIGVKVDAICVLPVIINNGILLGTILVGLNNTEKLNEEINLCYLIAQQSLLRFENSILTNHFRNLAITDHLTNLYNREHFECKLQSEIDRTQLLKKPLAFLEIDVDYFKQINDTHGHVQGDEVLKMVSHIIKSFIRDNDMAFRLGGDEFGIIMPTAGEGTALKVARRISQEYYQRGYGGNLMDGDGNIIRQVRSSFSIGISVYPVDTIDRLELLKKADAALYRAKKKKNCIALYSKPIELFGFQPDQNNMEGEEQTEKECGVNRNE